jgi:hypothetical protein
MTDPAGACNPDNSAPANGAADNGAAAPMESPSLAAVTGIPAYELKFLLSEAQAHAVEELARAQLLTDPHADPSRGNAYHTTSIYCDTAAFDVFHRRPPHKRRKHRLRRYQDALAVFLERKSKWGYRVKKRRTMIPAADLALFAHPMSLTDWDGHWFHRHLVAAQLQPVCRIAYERVALVGQAAEGPLRLTFDRHIQGIMSRTWSVDRVENGLPVLADKVICEFKYRAFLPSLFKSIIEALQLTPQPVSKYRTFLHAAGISQ